MELGSKIFCVYRQKGYMDFRSTKTIKNILGNGICLCASLILFSCVNDNEEDLVPLSNTPEGTITFQTTVRPIFENACSECHSNPPRNGAPQPLVTLEEIRFNVENRNLLGRINNLSSPMPPSGLLPENTRALIEQWVDQGFINQ